MAINPKAVEPRFLQAGTIKPNLFDDAPIEDIAPDLAILLKERFADLESSWPIEQVEEKDKIKRSVILHCIDQN